MPMSNSATGIGAAATGTGPTKTSRTTTPNKCKGPRPHLKDKDKAKLLLLSSSSSPNANANHNSNSHLMDLVPKGPSVVQLRPVRPVFSTITTTTTASSVNKQSPNSNNNGGGGGGGSSSSPAVATVSHGGVTPIISVNRATPANLTLLPARGTSVGGSGPAGGGGLGLGVTGIQGNTQIQGIPTYQITRVGNVRAGAPGIVQHSQQGSITVTPLSSTGLSASIRLAPGGTVNNGTWLQTSSVQGFAPIRAATTITVGGRQVRPVDGKMIHIPQQHIAQLQMVDGKGSILKPQLTTTPIVNIRGTLPGGATSGPSVTLPIPPFTIRTANITNISAIQPRLPVSTTSNQVHKVITQSGHGAPIQFVNANKNVIQSITPIPKLSTVCLTLSTNATLIPTNSSPVVAVASRTGATPSLIMTSANATVVNTTSSLPITKVYPVGRDGNIVESMFSTSGPSSAVSVSTVNLSSAATSNSNSPHSNVVTASGPPHVLVHNATINVHAHPGSNPSGPPPPNLTPATIAPGYYVDKNFHMNIVPHPQNRPIALDSKKLIDTKSLPPGSMIIATAASTAHPNTVTIPLTQHLNIAHLGQPPGNTHVNPSSTNISTSATSSNPSQNHHQLLAQIPHSMITSGGPPTITVTQSSQNQPLPHPAHVISQSIGVATTSVGSILTVTTTTISSSATSTGSSSVTSSCAPVTNTSSISSTSSTSTSTSSSASTTAPPAQSPNHNPNSNTNNNNNTKSTHSPRPSILRKRELGDHQSHSTSRVQRNLSLQLNFATSNSTNFTSSSNKENSLEKFPTGLITNTTITSSSVGGSIGTGSGVSILKKEFQPPTEECSWQSVSSNSSSGSSTISTTSETAELQLQQQQLSIAGGVDINLSTSLPLHTEVSPSAFVGVGLGSVLNNLISVGKSTMSSVGLTSGLSLGLNNSSNSSSTTTSSSQNQNGVLRSTQPRSRSSSTSKSANKDVERLKNKDKDLLDACSPRKKPRKQQLTSSDLLEAASPEIYYQGKGKRFRKGDLMDFTEGITEKEKVTVDPIPEEPPPPRIVYYVKKRHMSLLQSNTVPPKPLTTHFQRHSDVKAKDDKRPTVSELANQKNIFQKVSGWRVKHMTTQMQEFVDNETGVVNKCTALLNRFETKVQPCADRDLNIVMELFKGNIQRCKVIRDQMSDSRAQVIKILEHKANVIDVINKYSSKRPQTKKRVF